MNPFAKKLNLPAKSDQGLIPTPPTLTPVVATPSPESVVKTAVHNALASNVQSESLVIPDRLTPDTISHADIANDPVLSDSVKLSKLIDDDFPFDDSQLAAIYGMASQKFGCITGAAGTGKTTSIKKFIDLILNESATAAVDLSTYFSSGYESDDAEDEYEAPQRWVPAVCMVGFTGRSAQMIKKNFPRDWHGNIMTIHRMLAFKPVFYTGMKNESTGEMEYFDEDGTSKGTRKMEFVPTYNADCLLPWDVILIDESGMVPLDLWHQILAAMKKGCRVYMIGDINQLPPVHGRSIFGFALSKWPAWELTHIHRQQGKDNPIVDNAWRVLKGIKPVSSGAFQMVELKGDAAYSSRQVRAMVPKLQERGVYEPNRDTIITPINGEDGSRGFALGQLPLNREFALIFNPAGKDSRYIIDAGRERRQFAVGDRVMATRNDHEVGITNGMTGIICDITEHEGYSGDRTRYGTIAAVNAYIESATANDDDDDFTLEELTDSFNEYDTKKDKEKEKQDRGPASHVVTVRFGEDEHAFEIPFATLAEVASLMTAYVVTCHKMQGGEAPTIVIILHDSHKAMLYREWLYTAITRASQRCILLYSPDALRAALNKQKITGSTLQEKVAMFNRLQDPNGILGASVSVRLPEPETREGVEVDLTKTTKVPHMAEVIHAPASTIPTSEATMPRFKVKTTIDHGKVVVQSEAKPNPLASMFKKKEN